MTTTVISPALRARTESFWFITALAMTAVLIAGFSLQLGMGRSSFAVPIYVHVHAFVFFGWTMLYLLQNGLIAANDVAMHRRLGWLAVAWIPAMVAMGIFITVVIVRRGTVPFFFEPNYFLIMNPLSILVFAGLAGAAIAMRRKTQWHRRLMFCAMALILGPGFGRLLPMPLLIPWAAWAVFAACMIFPLAGVIRDLRRTGRVHPAWRWGIGIMVATQIAFGVIADSPVGGWLYRIATRGAPGAAVAPRGYPAFPRA